MSTSNDMTSTNNGVTPNGNNVMSNENNENNVTSNDLTSNHYNVTLNDNDVTCNDIKPPIDNDTTSNDTTTAGTGTDKDEKRNKKSQHCSGFNCRNSRQFTPELSFFRFPKDEQRSRIWAVNCGRDDLLKKTARQMFNSNVLCEKHFEASQFRSADKRNRLSTSAIPTLFDVPYAPKHPLPPSTLSSRKNRKFRLPPRRHVIQKPKKRRVESPRTPSSSSKVVDNDAATVVFLLAPRTGSESPSANVYAVPTESQGNPGMPSDHINWTLKLEEELNTEGITTGTKGAARHRGRTSVQLTEGLRVPACLPEFVDVLGPECAAGGGGARKDAPTWCRCGNCSVMSAKADNVCCHATQFAHLKGTLSCLTWHEGFMANCTNVHVLRVSYLEFLEANGPVGDEVPIHKSYQHLAHRRFSGWMFGLLGKGKHKGLPSCCLLAIRKAFPP